MCMSTDSCVSVFVFVRMLMPSGVPLAVGVPVCLCLWVSVWVHVWVSLCDVVLI